MDGIKYDAAEFARTIVYANELRGKMDSSKAQINGILNTLSNADPEMGISGETEEIRNQVNQLDVQINETIAKLNSARSIIESTDASVAATINHYISNEIEYLTKNDGSFVYYSTTDGYELSAEDWAYVKEHCRDILYAENSYGGNQELPFDVYDINSKYIDIVKQYFPKMSDEEAIDYLKGMQKTGCGYVSTANYIFEGYADRPEQFEKDFGFPMYIKLSSGEIVSNVNYLATDVYCSSHKNKLIEDDKEFNIKYLFNDDVEYSYAGSSERSYGTDINDRSRILNSERYSNANVEKGLIIGESNNIQDYDDVIRRNLDNGNLIEFCATDFTLYKADENNNRMDSNPSVYLDAPHAMTITGINDDGDYVISSWGDKYILDSESVDPNFTLERVAFND